MGKWGKVRGNVGKCGEKCEKMRGNEGEMEGKMNGEIGGKLRGKKWGKGWENRGENWEENGENEGNWWGKVDWKWLEKL